MFPQPHAFIHTLAPANKAAAPIAPVFIGAAAPELELDVAVAASMDVAAATPPPIIVVGVGTPEVNGSSEALEAPLKATDCEEAVATGVAIVMSGFSTLIKG